MSAVHQQDQIWCIGKRPQHGQWPFIAVVLMTAGVKHISDSLCALQVMIAFLINNAALPFCAAYTVTSPYILWSGKCFAKYQGRVRFVDDSRQAAAPAAK